MCSEHQGKVDCVPMLLTAVSLSKGKLEEKYKGTLLYKVDPTGDVHGQFLKSIIAVLHVLFKILCMIVCPPLCIALFKVASRGEESMDVEGVTSFLEHAMMIGQSMSQEPFCSMHIIDACARECFRKVDSHILFSKTLNTICYIPVDLFKKSTTSVMWLVILF